VNFPMHKQKNYTILIGILGTVFEWLEYSYYGYLSTKISQLFLPHYDPRTGLLATMAIFAAGFLMRPIGGIVFGYIGDRTGRKNALFISLFLMGCSTLLMGLLPTYESIGIYAPLLLLLCRLLQGLAVSGEFNGAAIFLIEHNKATYPTLAGSWVGLASALGMLLGAIAATVVSFHNMPNWAWRVPFLLAFVSCLIASYLRYRLLETPAFLDLNRNQIIKTPIIKIFREFKIPFLKNLLLAANVSVFIYICNVYTVSYLIKDIQIPAITATTMAAIGQLFVVLFFPLAAILADRKGDKRVMFIGLLLSMVTTPLLFMSIQSRYISMIVYTQVLYGIANAFAFAPIFNFIYRLFPTSVRYTGNATAWSVGVALFGSTAPFVANYLMTLDSILGPTLYVAIFMLIAGIIITRPANKSDAFRPQRTINGVQVHSLD
jgi:MFS transporter, MHS family, proline/betaine transporter